MFAALGDEALLQNRWVNLAHRVGFELRWGTLETAERLSAEMSVRAAETGEPDAALWYLNCMGFTYRQAGRYDEALALFAPIMATDTYLGFATGAIAAMVLCEAERHDEARPMAQRSYPWGRDHPRDQSLLPNLGPLAIAAAELGDRDNAGWLLDRLEPLKAYWSAWSGQAPIAPVSTLVGRLRATLGDFEGADTAFDEAVIHCRSTDARFFIAEALLYQGLARRDAGRTGEAVTDVIAEAAELAIAGGYGTLRRRAEMYLVGRHEKS
jgi:tetratricopeptide (TPR) repeat protein